MKTITIGRSAECNITIEHELISRKHALLKLYPSGKIEIVDMGLNGTSVNGVKIQPNVPKRINRNDVVTFASSKSLDWNLVPPTHNWYLYYALTAIALIVLGVLLYFLLGTSEPQQEEVLAEPTTEIPIEEAKEEPTVIVIQQPEKTNKEKPVVNPTEKSPIDEPTPAPQHKPVENNNPDVIL